MSIGLHFGGCRKQEENNWVEWGGPNKRTHLLIFFKQGTTNAEVNAFLRDVIDMEAYNLAFRFRAIKDDHEGVGVNFSTNSTPEQREQLKRNVSQSPIVYRIYEDVVPNEVRLE
jgi:hypothetical protein